MNSPNDMDIPDYVVGTDKTSMYDNESESRYGSVLGRKVTEPLDRPEAIPLPPGKSYLGQVTMVSEFFVSFCPETGGPDHGTVTIRFMPDQHILESKSLKLYLMSFNDRNKPGMAEGLARRICDEIFEVLKPITLGVIVKQAPRGDISIEAEATQLRPSDWDDLIYPPLG